MASSTATPHSLTSVLPLLVLAHGHDPDGACLFAFDNTLEQFALRTRAQPLHQHRNSPLQLITSGCEIFGNLTSPFHKSWTPGARHSASTRTARVRGAAAEAQST
uniref:Uncharacterized protein n=1 Tax=Mycena chlorophos TaxID=658473 RepID=A0ABQ0LZV0_MYCCL|nr:predicted protein [Mycena chlorophos]